MRFEDNNSFISSTNVSNSINSISASVEYKSFPTKYLKADLIALSHTAPVNERLFSHNSDRFFNKNVL